MAMIENMPSSFGHFYAEGSRDFAGRMPYVSGCRQRTETYKAMSLLSRSDVQVAAGETHQGNPQTDEAVTG